VTPEVARIADQVLAEYGEEVIKKKKKKVKKQQIPNMKEDMKNLKVKTRYLSAFSNVFLLKVRWSHSV
jgi:hypothetical protein